MDFYELARRTLAHGYNARPSSAHLTGERNAFSPAKAKAVHLYIDTLAAFLRDPDPAIAAELIGGLAGAATPPTGAARRIAITIDGREVCSATI